MSLLTRRRRFLAGDDVAASVLEGGRDARLITILTLHVG